MSCSSCEKITPDAESAGCQHLFCRDCWAEYLSSVQNSRQCASFYCSELTCPVRTYVYVYIYSLWIYYVHKSTCPLTH